MDKLKNIFWNGGESRLRAGWRILAFVVILAAIAVPAQLGIRAVLGSLSKDGILVWAIIGVSATLAAYISRRYIDKKSFVSYGLVWDRAAVLDIIAGVVNSAIVMAVVYYTMLWSGLIEFNGFSWWMEAPGDGVTFTSDAIPVILKVLFILTIVAWWEELAFRGVILQNMMEGMNLMWATILSSLMFGFVHYGNPNATILSSLLIAVITFQIIYSYVKTGQLWLPVGIHLGWNFFQGSIFGFGVSGQETPSLISQTQVGPELWTGGAFGPEASLLIIPASIFSMFMIHWWVRMSRAPEQKFMEFIVK